MYVLKYQWTTCTIGVKGYFWRYFCCYGNKVFLNNANGRSNHAKFEAITDFIKILEVSNFHIGLYYVWQFLPYVVQTYGKITSRIFIKSVIAQKNLNLCMMITTTISIVQKNFCCHSNRNNAKNNL